MAEEKEDTKNNIDEEFASSTTCHGLYHIYNSCNLFVRLFWIALVLGMVGALTSQITLRIMAYCTYDTSTDIEEKFVASIDFPAVTICSFNRYFLRPSEAELQAIHTLNRLYSSAYGAYRKHMGARVNISALDALGENFNVSQYTMEHGFSIEGRGMHSCTFKSQPCQAKEFKSIFTTMGRCHTFNEGDTSRRFQNIPGSGHGLSMLIRTNEDMYTEEPRFGNAQAGLKIQVHPPYEAPDVETYGLSIPVGAASSVEVMRSDHVMMYQPWGVCDSSRETLKYFTIYTLNNCLHECLTDKIIQKCDCRLYSQYWAAEYAPECSVLQMSECASELTVEAKQNLSATDCGCTIPCEFTEYTVMASYAKFPNKPTSEFLQREIGLSKEDVAGNALSIEVFFDSLSYQVFTQSKKSDESSLVSDIGGQLGLWLGMSFLTVIEFFQYFVKKISRKLRTNRSVTTKGIH